MAFTKLEPTSVNTSAAFTFANANVTANLNVSGKTNLGSVSNLTITGGTSGYVLRTNGAGVLSWVAQTGGGGGGTPGGNTTEVQYNNAGSFDGTDSFKFDNGTNTLSVTNIASNGYPLTNLNGSNILGQVGNALLSGTVYSNDQPNITSVGTLANLTVTANITSGNANLGNAATASYFVGNGSLLTGLPASYSNTNVAAYLPTYSGNVAGAYFIGNGSTLTNLAGGNVSGQVANALIAGTVYTGAQPNITSTGTLTSLTVSGATDLGAVTNIKITGGLTNQVLTTDGLGNLTWTTGGGGGGGSAGAGFITITKDVFTATGSSNTYPLSITPGSVAYIVVNIDGIVQQLSSYSLSTNVVTIIGMPAAGEIIEITSYGVGGSPGGNTTEVQFNNSGVFEGSPALTFANSTGTLSATNFTGNLTTAAQPNITSVGTLSSVIVTSNANVGNLNATGTGSFSGNVNINSNHINNVADPHLDQDAATKKYVDGLVSTGLYYHSPVTAATTTTLAVATGGTITYNNGTSGVNANLVTTGSFNLIDTANVQTVGTRILVKNEANATWNGVYTWANTTTIVRSTDADSYGTGTGDLSLNDYFFVSGGSTNKGVAYVCTTTGTITFGTTNIDFSQFSTSQVYSAGQGLTLTDLTFNVNNAQPNITSLGTLTSVTITGNVTSGNANLGNAVTANYFLGNGSQLTGVTATTATSATTAATVTTNAQPNITSVGTLTSLTITGNITSGNANLGNAVTSNYFLGNGSQLTGITASTATTAATVTTNAQPNITSVGTLTTLGVSGLSIVGSGVVQNPPTGANILTNATLAAGGNGTNYLAVGQYDSSNGYAMWMQAGYSNSISNPYNIVMQPIGGNVAIGNVANSSAKLTVSGNLLVTGGGLTVTGTSTFSSSQDVTVTGTPSGTVAYDLYNGLVFDVTPSANWTANVSNIPTTNNRTTVVTFIITQGATPYVPNVFQISGVGQTVKWINGTTPGGTASKTDVVSFSMIRSSGGAWTVLGQSATYG